MMRTWRKLIEKHVIWNKGNCLLSNKLRKHRLFLIREIFKGTFFPLTSLNAWEVRRQQDGHHLNCRWAQRRWWTAAFPSWIIVVQPVYMVHPRLLMTKCFYNRRWTLNYLVAGIIYVRGGVDKEYQTLATVSEIIIETSGISEGPPMKPPTHTHKTFTDPIDLIDNSYLHFA